MKETDVEKRAEAAIEACLEDVPFVRVKKTRRNVQLGNIEADLLVDLQIADGPLRRIVVEAKASGQPRLAREAANHLLRLREESPGAYGVFMAPYISPASAGICRKEGIGYLDLAGNCGLCFEKVFIRREGIPNPFAERRALRSLYAAKSARVLRVLLMRNREWWRTQALSKEAAVSLGQVANVKNLLRDREWIVEGSKGFKLSDPSSLLKEWSENYTYRKNAVRDFYSLKRPEEVEEALAKTCAELAIRYAFTGFSAARRIAPAVRGQRAMGYLTDIPDALLEKAGLKEVDSGANASLMIPYDDGVYYMTRDVDSLRVVCPVQLYLDLKAFKGRGEEAAEAIWKKELSALW
ncbi:MAG: type IV toxin-antitoxin system AbiEi family antitoxin [Spirochaetia bacterium]